MGLLNSIHADHGSLSAYHQEGPRGEMKSSLAIKGFIEKHYSLRVVLLLFVLMGTSMVIGDGIFTPTMSGNEARLRITHFYERGSLVLYNMKCFSFRQVNSLLYVYSLNTFSV